MAGFAGVHVLAAPSRADGPVAAAVVAVLVLGVLAAALAWVVPGAAKLRTAWTVLAQSALAYAAVAGGTSVGLLGFAAGTLLLAGGRLLAVAVVASAAAIEAVRGGAPADAAITVTLLGLIVYGVVRLVERVDDAAAARLPLTMAAVEPERYAGAPVVVSGDQFVHQTKQEKGKEKRKSKAIAERAWLPAAVAERDAVRGTSATVHTGTDRGRVEFLGAEDARIDLISMGGALGGTSLLVAVLVVSGTFALSVRQREREIAPLRAVAATPRRPPDDRPRGAARRARRRPARRRLRRPAGLLAAGPVRPADAIGVRE
ncbi:hypothetical protein ACFHW2_08340 [Actinomadura sp. LOL_016]|uniref:hypothetical protein n=1 Tax=unclassified Actinomadura TaxID=2626254 RepID=UPI003A808589